MRRRCSILLLLALIISGLGCQDRSGDRTTIVYSYGRGGEIKELVLAELVEGFERENPNIRIFLHPLPTGTDQQRTFYLSSLAARSNFIDVFEADVIWTAEFAAAELLLDLTERPAFAETSDFIDPLVQQATYDDRLYAAPYYATFGVLFYRQDLLRQHGLDSPRSLNELVAVARTISEAEGIAGFLWQADDYEGLACNFFEFYLAHGGDLVVEEDRVELDLEVTERTLQFMFDTMQTSLVTPQSALTHDEVDSTNFFRRGGAVFMRNWHSASPYILEGEIGDNFGVTLMPPSNTSLTGGWLLAVNARSNHPDEAVRFVEHMISAESQRLLLERRGQGPALRSMYPLANEERVILPREILEHPTIRPRSPYYFELSQVLTEEVRRVLQRESSVEGGAQRIVERTRELSVARRAAPDFPESSFMMRFRP